eukprot:CFRG8582T1
MIYTLGQDPYEKRRDKYGYKEPLTDAEKERIKNKTREEYEPGRFLEGHNLKVWQDIQWRKDHDEYDIDTKKSPAGSIFVDIGMSVALGAATGGPFGAIMGVFEAFATLIIGGVISAITEPKARSERLSRFVDENMVYYPEAGLYTHLDYDKLSDMLDRWGEDETYYQLEHYPEDYMISKEMTPVMYDEINGVGDDPWWNDRRSNSTVMTGYPYEVSGREMTDDERLAARDSYPGEDRVLSVEEMDERFLEIRELDKAYIELERQLANPEKYLEAESSTNNHSTTLENGLVIFNYDIQSSKAEHDPIQAIQDQAQKEMDALQIEANTTLNDNERDTEKRKVTQAQERVDEYEREVKEFMDLIDGVVLTEEDQDFCGLGESPPHEEIQHPGQL